MKIKKVLCNPYHDQVPRTVLILPTDSIVTFDSRFVHACPVCGWGILSTPIKSPAAYAHSDCYENSEDIEELMRLDKYGTTE